MRDYNRTRKSILGKILLIPMLIAILFAVAIISDAITLDQVLTAGSASGVMCASMALIGNIGRVSDKFTAGKQIIARVILITLDQIDESVPFPTPNAAREVGTIPLKKGEFMHSFQAIDDSLEDKSSGSKGDITTEVTNEFTFILGGHRGQIHQFLEDHAGDRFIIIYQMTDRSYWVLGNDLKPMLLKSFERLNGKDSRSATVTFGNTSFEQPYKYVGSIVTVPPVELAADATSIAFSAAQQYTTGDNAGATTIATFSGLSASDIGRTVEICGGGGAYPTQIAETDGIILRGGETWIGNAGSSIVFQVLDANTLVEVSRVQTA
ncbi:MAG: hypothetical protein IKB48_05740 [Bacteroidales bacterium]|nr:hypothetical protein [Bacteroidales bacterium]